MCFVLGHLNKSLEPFLHDDLYEIVSFLVKML